MLLSVSAALPLADTSRPISSSVQRTESSFRAATSLVLNDPPNPPALSELRRLNAVALARAEGKPWETKLSPKSKNAAPDEAVRREVFLAGSADVEQRDSCSLTFL
jgi:hypothetical protein